MNRKMIYVFLFLFMLVAMFPVTSLASHSIFRTPYIYAGSYPKWGFPLFVGGYFQKKFIWADVGVGLKTRRLSVSYSGGFNLFFRDVDFTIGWGGYSVIKHKEWSKWNLRVTGGVRKEFKLDNNSYLILFSEGKIDILRSKNYGNYPLWDVSIGLGFVSKRVAFSMSWWTQYKGVSVQLLFILSTK